MKLGDRIKLHSERQPLLSSGEVEVIDGEFIVIGVSYGMPHCFGKDSWGQGFNSFDIAKEDGTRPDLVKVASIYVPTPNFLDMDKVEDLHHDRRVVKWEVLATQRKEVI